MFCQLYGARKRSSDKWLETLHILNFYVNLWGEAVFEIAKLEITFQIFQIVGFKPNKFKLMVLCQC